MFRYLIRTLIALPVLALGLAAPQAANAQSGYESLLDLAPGAEPPARDGGGDRDGSGFRDDEGGFRDDDPEIDDMLDNLDRNSRRDSPDVRRRDRDRDRERDSPDDFDDDDFDRDEDERDPPPRRDRDRRDGFEETRDPAFEKAEPGLGHKVIAGLWSGTVEEVGADPYTLSLSLKEDGTGTADYPAQKCVGDVVPIAGRLMEYRETITQGREKCADGIVQLRLRRGLLLWTWKDDKGEVKAAATLRRSAGEKVTEKLTGDPETGKFIGDDILSAPQAAGNQPAE